MEVARRPIRRHSDEITRSVIPTKPAPACVRRGAGTQRLAKKRWAEAREGKLRGDDDRKDQRTGIAFRTPSASASTASTSAPNFSFALA
jgi:hypothetical protein